MSNRRLIDATPSLSALAHVLRHKELWPAGFRWNFANRCTCAMGLAAMLWPEDFPCVDYEAMAEVFEMPLSTAEKIFHGGMWIAPLIRPTHVAKRIDKYLLLDASNCVRG